MPIQVVCQGCKAGFQVSEKFAGKKGPCPKCKAIITIPMAKDDIVIHAPETTGPKDSTGRPVFTPILRQEAKISPLLLGASIGGVILTLLIAVILRLSGKPVPTIFLILGAVLLAPPLGIAGYAMFRDPELEPYRGTELFKRVGISSLIYAILWGAFCFMPPLLGLDPPPYDLPTILMVVPAIVGIGGFAGYLIYDVEVTTGYLHYGMYLALTTLLAWIANVPLIKL